MTRLEFRRRFLRLLNGTLNPLTTRIAKSGRGPFSLIRHVGRKTGQAYETPVILAHVREGFIAELTYGENVNWYRNVIAAGGCTVLSRGTEYHVSSIERCDARTGRAAYPEPFRLVLKLLGRTEFRLLHVDASSASQRRLSQTEDDPRRGESSGRE